jgi:hypothetical protein
MNTFDTFLDGALKSLWENPSLELPDIARLLGVDYSAMIARATALELPARTKAAEPDLKDQIRKALRLGFTQRETALKVGCSRSYVERVASEGRPIEELPAVVCDDTYWRTCLRAGGFVAFSERLSRMTRGGPEYVCTFPLIRPAPLSEAA